MSTGSTENFLPTEEQTSAGGVAYRGSGSTAEIVIVLVVPEKRWQIPKGLIDPGETAEQAAVREVREEAGVEAEIVAPIETTEYWFTATWNGERKRFHKHVHFYLMKALGGDVADHDDEVAEARWVPVRQALEMLEFESERAVVRKALTMINA